MVERAECFVTVVTLLVLQTYRKVRPGDSLLVLVFPYDLSFKVNLIFKINFKKMLEYVFYYSSWSLGMYYRQVGKWGLGFHW